MLHFKKLELDDIYKVKDYFHCSTNRTCDNTVGGTFMWRDYFSLTYAEYNETVIFKAKIKYYNGITAFSVPLGKDLHGGIREINLYCESNNVPVAFCTATNGECDVLRQFYKDIQLYNEAGWSDYIYRAEDLIGLSGKKYAGQRNHINFFKRTYANYSFEEISDSNLAEVKAFYHKYNDIVNKVSDIYMEEQGKTFEVLDNYDTYGLIGGCLRIDGQVAAFSIGETYRDVLYVHIEKADTSYRGSYPMIVNEFAKHYATRCIRYVNREEDVGDEGLRTSKLSYHPCDIIKKYIVIVG